MTWSCYQDQAGAGSRLIDRLELKIKMLAEALVRRYVSRRQNDDAWI